MANTDERQSKPVDSRIEREVQEEAETRVSRRRALIAGLAAAPALLTLMRRPVWAQTRVASAGICASLAAASSLHTGDAELATNCAALESSTTP